MIIPMYKILCRLARDDTLPGVIIVYIGLILPYTVWTLRGFIVNVPRELDEAALIDGCTRWQMFHRIILPLVGPGLVATSLYGFIQIWNEWLIISTINRDNTKHNLMVWLHRPDAAARHRVGSADGQRDHHVPAGGDRLPVDPAPHRDRLDGGRGQGLTVFVRNESGLPVLVGLSCGSPAQWVGADRGRLRERQPASVLVACSGSPTTVPLSARPITSPI